MASIEEERSLLQNEESLLQEVNLYAEDGSVDMHGNPPLKQKTGTWKACPFILGNECCERLAYFGIAKNLVTYFTTQLHETNVSAARHVMLWQATCYISPLIGALMADAYWGRYWTIAGFSAIYVMGMSVLTLSASIPGLKPAECSGSLCPSATPVQYAVFFSGLYLMALGTGGIKPCVSSFGADQFDDNDQRERVKKASFFNWFFFSIHIGSLISTTFLVWVQEKCGWGLGLLIPTVFMGLSIASFFSGTPLYRFQKPSGSPITRVFQVLVAAYRKLNLKLPEDHTVLFETQDKNSAISGSRKMEHTNGYRCLDKAAVITDQETRCVSFPNPWKLCTVTQIEEVKVLIRMFPIWACGIVYPTLHSQIFTLYVQQGRTMNRTIGSFEIPPATLGVFDTTSILICIPIYDRIVVPLVRRITGKPKGFTDLQRMGLGLLASVLSMSMAAIVETVRLKLARDLDLVESGASVPMSIFWQVPQFFLMGTSGVLFYVGRLEFFYEQSPDAMRSVCSAWGLLASSIGIYFSSMILTLVAYFTTRDGGPGWIPPENLNKGHLDYYFCLLAFIGSVNIPVFVYFAVRYTQKKVS